MVNMENYEEYMLLYADDELDTEATDALLDFVQQHPELQKELEAYAATRLQPDMQVMYADKQSLLKQAPTGGHTTWLGGWKAYAAAACILLAITLFFINKPPQETAEPAIAKNITEPATTAAQPAPGITPVQEQEPQKKLYSSKTVNTIAMETPVRSKAQEPAPAPEQPSATGQPVAVLETAPPAQLVIHTPAQELQPVPVPEPPVAKPAEPAIPASLLVEMVTEKAEPFNHLGNALNDKLLAVRNAQEQIKDTDVTFRIGKKEIFTVRL